MTCNQLRRFKFQPSVKVRAEIALPKAVLSSVAVTFAITGPIERKLSYPVTRLSSY